MLTVKQEKKLGRKRERIVSKLAACFPDQTEQTAAISDVELVMAGYYQSGKKTPEQTHYSYPELHSRFDAILRWSRTWAGLSKPVGRKKNDVNSKAFLESYAWRKLRMAVLKKHGAACQCCGQSRVDGIIIHVDHIKPRKKYPELALDINNLQILCDECNHGKGNWDETDWR